MTQEQFRTGRVKFFNHARGYGFIEPDSGGDDAYINVGSFASLAEASKAHEGTRVRFRTRVSKMGSAAYEASVIDGTPKVPEAARIFRV